MLLGSGRFQVVDRRPEQAAPGRSEPDSRRRPTRKTTAFRPGSPFRPLEVLEDRKLLALNFSAVGPFAMEPVGGANNPFVPYVGAVQNVVPSPADAKIIWIGTINGGVWRTNNADIATPTWVAQTDQMPSLSIGALTLDPTDATSLTLVAGIGRYSSFAERGGALTGVLKTTDGGTNWVPVGQNDLAGRSVRGVAGRGNVILAATDGGLFRSGDGGASFQLVTIDATRPITTTVDDLAGDPGNSNRLFAASGAGIYVSENLGVDWKNITGAATTGTLGALFDTTLTRVKMSVYDTALGTNPVVYAGIINSGQVSNIFRSNDLNGSWTALGLPFDTSAQGRLHFAITADQADANRVYIARAANGIYRGQFTGANPAAPGRAATWTTLSDGSPTPNSDPRDMAIDRNGNLVDGDDGGVNRLSRPTTDNKAWTLLSGNTLQNSELFSVAFDPTTKTIVSGAQDNGDPASRADGTWFDAGLSLADGGYVQVDPSGVRYTSNQSLSNFNRRTLAAASATTIGLQVVNTNGTASGQTLRGYVGANNDSIPFYTPIALNAVDPTRLVIGTEFIYESSNRGDTIRRLNDTGFGTTLALAYGGKNADGSNNADVLFVGTSTSLALRSAGGALARVTTYPGVGAQRIALDPNNWQTAFVIDQNNQVWRTTDAGATAGNWANLTGNIVDPSLQAISIIPNPNAAMGTGSGTYAVLLGGQNGVFRAVSTDPANWSRVSNNLPNVPVTDMQYSSANGNDTLVVATLGRGVWQVSPFRTVNAVANPDLFAVPPTISPIPGQAVAVGTALPAVTFTVGSPTTTADTLTVTAISSNQGLVPNANLTLGGTGANRTVTITPVANRAGTAQITVTVSDGTTSSFRTFRFVAANLGAGPAFFPVGDQIVQQGTAVIVVPLKTQGIDLNTAPAGTATSNPVLFPDITLDRTAGTLVIRPANLSGTGTVILAVTVNGQEVRVSLQVTVLPPPLPPVIQKIANQTDSMGGKEAFRFQVIDPPKNPNYEFIGDIKTLDTPVGPTNEREFETVDLTFFVDSSNPDLIAVDNIDVIEQDSGDFTLDYTPAAGKSGTATITITAFNGDFASSTSFDVTVNPAATPPVVTLGQVPTLAAGAPFPIAGAFTSPANGPFVATATYGDNSGLQTLPIGPGRTFRLSHVYARPGTYLVTAGVLDGNGMVGFQTITLTVTPPTPSGSGTGRDAFVTTLYVENLGRLPEPSGLRYWSGLLAVGVKPKTVARAIWGSPEHHFREARGLVHPISFARTLADALRADHLAASFTSRRR